MKPTPVLTHEQAEEIMKRAFEYARLQYDYGCDAMSPDFSPNEDEQRFIERQIAFDHFKEYIDALTLPIGLTNRCAYFYGYRTAVREYCLLGAGHCERELKEFETEIERTPFFNDLHLGYADGFEDCLSDEL